MTQWYKAVHLMIGTAFLLIGVFQIWALTQYRNKKTISSTTAKLIKTKCKKNADVRVGGGFRTRKVPYWTEYIYVYTKNDKQYKIKGGIARAPGNLPKMPTVVYLTKFPRHGYIPEMPYMREPIVALGCIFLAAVCFFAN